MRSIAKRRVLECDATTANIVYLCSNRKHGITESIELGKILALCRLNHESSGDWPGHGGRVETIILQPLRNILLRDAGGGLERSQIQNKFVGALAVLADVEDIIGSIQPSGHVVGIEDGISSSILQSLSSVHLYVHPRDWKNCGRSKGGTSNGSLLPRHTQIRSTKLSRSLGIHNVAREEGCEVGSDSDRSHARSSTTVGNAEGLVKIQVTNIGTDQTRAREADLGIHVGAIHIHLTAGLVDGLDDFLDRLLENSKG
mmetsp:Transcript_25785/g.74613  ORF Transcript_25785/g.74613 Transcript_25785/m.74613 type:complete len:257 (+) Transcript_25785:401-1171(+)